ncbi:MAG: tetratricopeptide repeat protein [Caulobacteraceae bacterium]
MTSRNAEALEALDRAIELRPDYADAWTNRGTGLQALGRLEEALESFDKALSLRPDHAGMWSNRSFALNEMRRFDEAFEASAKAVSLDARDPESLNNHGVALQSLGRMDEAMAAYDRAVTADPTGASAWNNRGLALQALGRFDAARASFDKALALKPDFPDALWNKSLLLIAFGEYEEGWKLFEWRWKRSGRDVERLPDFGGAPVWLGETSPKGKRVLIHAEQGFGDTICMLRYIPKLAEQGAKVVVSAPPAAARTDPGPGGRRAGDRGRPDPGGLRPVLADHVPARGHGHDDRHHPGRRPPICALRPRAAPSGPRGWDPGPGGGSAWRGRAIRPRRTTTTAA